MKTQHVNRVDLSLDDIIRMDGLGQQADQNRGGNNRQQSNMHNRGQGLGGFRTGQHGGGGRNGSGVSPLNRDKFQQSGSGSNTMTNNRNQSGGSNGQRMNGRGWVNKRGNGQWGGTTSSGGRNNNMMHQGNNRQNNNRQFNNNNNNNPRFTHPGQGNSPRFNRGNNGNPQRRGNMANQGNNARGGMRQGQDLRGGMNQGRGQQGGMNQGQGQRGGMAQNLSGSRGGLGQGNLRISVGQGIRAQGQGDTQKGQHGLHRMTVDEKRQKAMQALREARKTIAQLDQQAARQNLFNSRRGITPQSSGLQYQNKNDDMYTSSLSLASSSSDSSTCSERHLEGMQITSFDTGSQRDSARGQKRWQHKPIDSSESASTLTISIDNSAPVVSHSDSFSPRLEGSPLPRHQHKKQQHWQKQDNRQHWQQQPQDNRQHWQQQQQDRHQQQDRQQWQQQDNSGVRSADSLDFSRGATPNFVRQLAQLKPTIPMKYVFQKRTFSTASTPVSLNDRFSEPVSEDPLGRKVFM